ncbi:MAG: DUF4367 domain-containing protein [Oscillospiraceae bacterium]|nr:DUF4367 domain-containing protein [Oscillospiraceae bacterium]
MQECNNLYEALILVIDDDIRNASKSLSEISEHQFSPEFEREMARLIKEIDEKEKTDETVQIEDSAHEHRTVLIFGKALRRSIAVMIAAVLILAMAATSIAVIKPNVYYVIKEKITHWLIDPAYEGDVDINFVPYKFILPDEYAVIDEQIEENSYEVRATDKNGHVISISQYAHDTGVSFQIDSEGENIVKDKINGSDIVISIHEPDITVLVENDQYVFLLAGNCDYEVIDNIVKDIVKTTE